MGGVVKAEKVKHFEFRLGSLLSNNDLVYDHKASKNLLNMNNLFFDDAILEEAEEEDEQVDPALKKKSNFLHKAFTALCPEIRRLQDLIAKTQNFPGVGTLFEGRGQKNIINKRTLLKFRLIFVSK